MINNKTKDFIRKSKDIHGNKYNYDKTVFIRSDLPLTITCPLHGDFEQRPFSHVNNKQGCKLCAKDKSKLTFDDFIIKANNKHAGKYKYDKASYIDATTKIPIECPIHGIFIQKPTKHIHGQGCPKCAYITSSDKILEKANKYITKAKIKFDNYFKYVPESYSVKKGTIDVICPKHGKLTMKRYRHIKNGCPKCNIEKRASNDRFTTEDFIKKSKEVHGDRYTYENTKYVDSNHILTITCPVHGDFEQYPRNHYNGANCPKCTGNYIPTTKEWVVTAKLKHGDRYDYSNVNYINKKTKVNIKCIKHGIFSITPDDHIHKMAGCPKCSESKGEQRIRMFLELNKIQYLREFSFNNSRKRFDFYLPELNILIEYDGLQHFKPVDFFGGKEAFIKQQASDKEKNKLAKEYKIPLIRVPYLRINDVGEYVRLMLDKYVKYKVGNKYYRNLKELCIGKGLSFDTSTINVNHYRVKNVLILHAEKHVE